MAQLGKLGLLLNKQPGLNTCRIENQANPSNASFKSSRSSILQASRSYLDKGAVANLCSDGHFVLLPS